MRIENLKNKEVGLEADDINPTFVLHTFCMGMYGVELE